MASQTLLPGFRLYQSANASGAEIRSNFIVRLHEFDIIMNDIRRNPMKGSVQHFLLIGRRGSGKSTLLRRVQEEIESDEILNKQFININLAEEQADIYRLFDLWEKVLESLKDAGIEAETPVWEDNADYTKQLGEAIHNAVTRSNKKIILLLDNIDRIFENMGDEASLIREYLLNHDDIKIIGGSTKMTEDFWQYNKPFYQFFRVLELKPLTREEVTELLEHWSKTQGLPELEEFIHTKKGQIESVRLLTDGLPRTLQFFVSILLNRKEQNSYDYLKQIMDYVTPLYQERLNLLPAPHRKIVLQMAFIWEAAGTKQIAELCRLESKLVSANLKQLVEKGIVEKKNTRSKNHLYRISERFFNLWLIFTQGSPVERKKAKCLTIFLENFYSVDDIKRLTSEHLSILVNGKIEPNHAALFTKALAHSKHISLREREQLIEKTLRLNNLDPAIKQQLPEKVSDIFSKVVSLTKSHKIKEAIQLLQEIEQEDGAKYFLLQLLHLQNNDKNKAAKSIHKVITAPNTLELAASIEKVQHELDNMFEGYPSTDLIEYLYLSAAENREQQAQYKLAKFYIRQKENTKAITILKKEAKNKRVEQNLLIGTAFLEETKFAEAEEFLLKAVKKGDPKAKIALAKVFEKQKRYSEAETLLRECIEAGNIEAIGALVNILVLNGGNKEEIINLVASGAEKDDGNCLVFSGVFHIANNDFNGAEKAYLSAIEKGNKEAIFYLGRLYYDHTLQKEKALAIVEQHSFYFAHGLAILAWNGKFQLLEELLTKAINSDEGNSETVQYTFTELLVHHQKQLIKTMFNHPDFGERLKTVLLPR
ncbi:MAG: AAA family ATPase [Dinghuibacter sp.]|nr:AAA family ATPase [Dinghuibacter sp.]